MANEINAEESKISSEDQLVDLHFTLKVHPDFAELLNEAIAKRENLFADLNELALNAIRIYINNHPRMFDVNPMGLFCKDRKSTRLNSSHSQQSRMPSSA